jgi:hypothetical protein
MPMAPTYSDVLCRKHNGWARCRPAKRANDDGARADQCRLVGFHKQQQHRRTLRNSIASRTVPAHVVPSSQPAHPSSAPARARSPARLGTAQRPAPSARHYALPGRQAGTRLRRRVASSRSAHVATGSRGPPREDPWSATDERAASPFSAD